MANKTIGVDADKEFPEQPITNQKAIKSLWVGRKLTLTLPQTLLNDLKSECESRKLSHVGVLRDLAIAWLISNKDGIKKDEYIALIQSEINSLDSAAKDAAAKQKAKMSAHAKRTEVWKKQQEKKKRNPLDESLHKQNPFDGWLMDKPLDERPGIESSTDVS